MMSDTIVRRSTLPLSAAVDGEVVMFHPDRGAYFSLGDVGSRIWELVAEAKTIDTLCGILTEEYDVEPARCRTELVSFIGELHAAGLVELSA